jgi:hypothetical protein
MALKVKMHRFACCALDLAQHSKDHSVAFAPGMHARRAEVGDA